MLLARPGDQSGGVSLEVTFFQCLPLFDVNDVRRRDDGWRERILSCVCLSHDEGLAGGMIIDESTDSYFNRIRLDCLLVLIIIYFLVTQ